MTRLNNLLIAIDEAEARDCGQNAAKEAYREASSVEAEQIGKRIKNALQGDECFTIYELCFSSSARCDCGAGMAYPDGIGMHGAWYCSAMLLDKKQSEIAHTEPLPFSLYEIKSESQPSAQGRTTRPIGTHVECEPSYVCEACKNVGKWPQHKIGEGGRAYMEKLACSKCGTKYLHDNGSSNMNFSTRWFKKVVDDQPKNDTLS